MRTLYMEWRWRQFLRNGLHRHVGGIHGKWSCAKFVDCFHSSDTSKMRTYGTKHPWVDLETSRHRNSSSSTIHMAARFRHCCIPLSVKRWCQLNRARVAHDAHPAWSSYQNKCSKPGRSHHRSDICYGALKCYSSVYTTIPRTGI